MQKKTVAHILLFSDHVPLRFGSPFMFKTCSLLQCWSGPNWDVHRLDILMDRVEQQEQIDVFEVVKNMRNDRCNMVQAKVSWAV